MKFLELHSPFFKPLWRRVATVTVCLAWAAFEFVYASTLWGLLFLGLGLYAGLQFFILWRPPDE